MTTTSTFRVGAAERLANGTVRWYVQGKEEYPNLKAVYRHIHNLRHAYRKRGTILQEDEFVPIGIVITVYDP